MVRNFVLLTRSGLDFSLRTRHNLEYRSISLFAIILAKLSTSRIDGQTQNVLLSQFAMFFQLRIFGDSAGYFQIIHLKSDKIDFITAFLNYCKFIY